MAKNTTLSVAVPSEIMHGELDHPGVTRTVTVRRTVTRVCEVITDLHFSVPAQLPEPQVREARDGVLDLRTFTGDATAFVSKWAFIEVGHNAWMDCKGYLKDGSVHTFQVMVGKAITAGDVKNGLVRTLPRSELEKFPDHATLTVTLKVRADACGENGPMIVCPPLNLTLRKPYRNLTDFNDKKLGRWTIGSGAPDPRDITIVPFAKFSDGKPGFCVRNYTYSDRSAGPILQSVFNDLYSGDTYRFSVRVCRDGDKYNAPKLSLRKDSVDKTPVLNLVGTEWQTLSFTFVAGSAPVLLELYSHEASRMGNDWYMDDFLVESV
ncbi:hypothetical protein [Pseudomonas graminis]